MKYLILIGKLEYVGTGSCGVRGGDYILSSSTLKPTALHHGDPTLQEWSDVTSLENSNGVIGSTLGFFSIFILFIFFVMGGNIGGQIKRA